jgi:hypothetical protein
MDLYTYVYTRIGISAGATPWRSRRREPRRTVRFCTRRPRARRMHLGCTCGNPTPTEKCYTGAQPAWRQVRHAARWCGLWCSRDAQPWTPTSPGRRLPSFQGHWICSGIVVTGWANHSWPIDGCGVLPCVLRDMKYVFTSISKKLGCQNDCGYWICKICIQCLTWGINKSAYTSFPLLPAADWRGWEVRQQREGNICQVMHLPIVRYCNGIN